ncbi:hypothetical protein B566_EDAN019037 [Ephemera danica]|nr:hypothetical protein B566_EDAN019037 [Ephemera danica]
MSAALQFDKTTIRNHATTPSANATAPIRGKRFQKRQPNDNFCRLCKQRGHFERYCPKVDAHIEELRKQAQPNAQVASKKFSDLCMTHGHESRYCLQVDNFINSQLSGNPKSALARDPGEIEFTIDSGCTQHMVPEAHMLVQSVPFKTKINTANSENPLQSLSSALLSVAACTNAGYSFIFDKAGGAVIMKDGAQIAEAIRKGKDYVLQLTLDKPRALATKISANLWHERLGHPSIAKMKELQLRGNQNLETVSLKDLSCEFCDAAKITHGPYKRSDSHARAPLDLIHLDTWGPCRIKGNNNEQYFLLIMDDHSRYATAYFSTNKNAETMLEHFQNFLNWAERKKDSKVKTIRSDNGTELAEIHKYAASIGITIQLSTPHSPQQNGRVERLNRTLLERARACISAKDIPLKYWPEIIRGVTHAYNRLPHDSLKGASPKSYFDGRSKNYQPDISYMRPLGCSVTYWTPGFTRNKLEPVGNTGFLLGYSSQSKGYRILTEYGKVITSSSVRFHENKGFPTATHDKNSEILLSIAPEDASEVDKTHEDDTIPLGETRVIDIVGEAKAGRGRSLYVQWADEETPLWTPAVSTILGLKVIRGNSGIFIDQSRYTTSLLEKLGMAECKPSKLPMEPGYKTGTGDMSSTDKKLEENQGTSSKLRHKKQDEIFLLDYQSVIGGLIWLATGTRPDISLAVGLLSREVANPNADWASDQDQRKSTSAELILVNSSPVHWRSSKQMIIALSTVEAELVAATGTTCEIVWMKKLVEEILKSERLPPIILKIDNAGAKAIAEHGQVTRRTKHMQIKYKYISNCALQNLVQVEHVSTEDNHADIFTKPLPAPKFKKHLSAIQLKKGNQDVLEGVCEDKSHEA